MSMQHGELKECNKRAVTRFSYSPAIVHLHEYQSWFSVHKVTHCQTGERFSSKNMHERTNDDCYLGNYSNVF